MACIQERTPENCSVPATERCDSHRDLFPTSMTELIIVEFRRMNPSLSVVTPEFTSERARKGKGKFRCAATYRQNTCL